MKARLGGLLIASPLFNPLRGAQKRELTKRWCKEKEVEVGGGGVGYSMPLQLSLKGSFRLHLLFDNLNLATISME